MKYPKELTKSIDISSITNKKSSKPTQPIAVLVQEASNLYEWCLDDLEQLQSVGLTKEKINDLLPRIENCRKIQALWTKQVQTIKESRLKWRVELPKAMQLRKEVVISMRFAFRNHPELINRLPVTSKGNGYAFLIQALNDLAFLAKNNTSLLISINFDLALIDKLEETSDMLTELWAIVKVEENSNNDFKLLRNRSFWHLYQLVTEIREAGRYVFRNTQSRYVGYISPFWKQKRKKKSNNSTL
nr:hypothetical protein [uncultured Carboxylicivirga sp.]